MPLVDELLDGNKRFRAERFQAHEAEMTASPSKRLAVVACMDARYSIARVLGLGHGDAKIIRNAGNHIDESAVRSLVVAVHKLGVQHIAVLGHTDCGMTGLTGDTTIQASIAARTDTPADEVEREGFTAWLGAFDDPADQVRQGVRRIHDERLLPDDLDVFGLIYDNETGVVRAVK